MSNPLANVYTETFVNASRYLQVGNPADTNNILENFDGWAAWLPTAIDNITSIDNTDNCQYILYDVYLTVNLNVLLTPTATQATITLGNLPYKALNSTTANNASLQGALSIQNLDTPAKLRATANLTNSTVGNQTVITSIGGNFTGGEQYRVVGQFTYVVE